MTRPPAGHGWQSVREEVLRRIAAKDWLPGDLIPNEVDLARELGTARATVNRALRSLSEDGLLERRRKGGTRIARRPVSKATIRIPVLRLEIEGQGQRYGYRLLHRQLGTPPEQVVAALGAPKDQEFLRVISLHSADDIPYALEHRWIHVGTVPAARDEPFEAMGANEWLLHHLPFTRASSEFFAVSATDETMSILQGSVGAALIVHRRVTWLADEPITYVEVTFKPGHTIRGHL